MFKRILTTLLGLILGLAILATGILAVSVMVVYPSLPDLDIVTNYRPKIPLRIYTSDGQLIGEYGEERRAFTKIKDFPDNLKNAVLAAEDKRFYDHWGVDVIGTIRAMLGNVASGQVQSGASTITQQVAKNFFLSSEQSYRRKFNEALLAYKIEQHLTKDQILELYFNQIYLGQRAYGFAMASQVYFGKPVSELTLAESAILAGLPKAPSAFNPFVNPERAKVRQLYILNNMRELGFITQAQFDEAKDAPLVYQKAKSEVNDYGLYAAEMARQEMYDRYGEEAYTQGFKVYTTVDSKQQILATDSLRKGLLDFDRYQPYRGAEDFIDLSKLKQEHLYEELDIVLSEYFDVDSMIPAVVLKASPSQVDVYLKGAKTAQITGSGLSSAKRAILNKRMEEKAIQPGAIIRIKSNNKGNWQIVQMPEVEGALVSLEAKTGAIKTLVGGFDFHKRSFNRATQAWRQPGSTFKPFIYSAGIERGLTAATPINDAPISIPGMGPGGRAWEPKNSNNKYAGFISLRQALIASKNMVSIRILMTIGVDYAQQYIQRFGFSPKEHPASLSIALGSGSTTPLQLASAYTVFANGGYRVAPYVVDRVYDGKGALKLQTNPLIAGENAKLVIDPRNAFIMYNILKDVTRVGTASRASALGRADIAGKTGTTNEGKDAWFAGFNPNLVAVVYIGYDKPRSLGRLGYGGVAALPVWINYMRGALKDQPNVKVEMPKGLVNKGGEYFYEEFQRTNPELALDNRSSKDVQDDEVDINNPDIPASGVEPFTPKFTVPEGEQKPAENNSNQSTQQPKTKTENAVENIRENLF